jgi:hypothetical protein
LTVAIRRATRAGLPSHDTKCKAPLTCTVTLIREVAHGAVNHRRIDGKDGVAGSIPAGASTNQMTSAYAGPLHVQAGSTSAAVVRLSVRIRQIGLNS